MEGLANGSVPKLDAVDECLSNVARMHVVQGFHPQVWQHHFVAPRQSYKDVGIKVTGWINRHPSRTCNVSRVKDSRRKAMVPADVEQVRFNQCLLNAVFSKWLPLLIFACRDRDAMTMNPHRAAMDKVLHIP